MSSAIHSPNLFVITGGAGKTTLLRQLQKLRLACVPEVARQIIQEQVAADCNAVPWGDTARYTEIMLEREQTFAEAIQTHRVMEQAYGNCGYEAVELSRMSPEISAEFVLRKVSANVRRT